MTLPVSVRTRVCVVGRLKRQDSNLQLGLLHVRLTAECPTFRRRLNETFILLRCKDSNPDELVNS